jgi:tetratricopeptide (TPR) repeat protein
VGDVYARYLKEPTEASRIYDSIIEDNRRLEHPTVRMAAIRLGDLYADAGDVPKAAETYRLAAALGGDKFKSTAQSEAVTRGALLRIAEQKLRSGDIRQTRQLLERIELDYPEQKLEGLYRFLRAETDRFGGRYEEAIRNYEFLLKLTQWAGFRDRALHGIADCNARMGNAAKALEWLDALQKSFPGYYEKQKLADYRKTLDERLAREKASQQAGGVVRFAGFVQTFEPNETHPPADMPGFHVAPGEGIEGSQICALDSIPTQPPVATTQSYPVQNIDSSGTYWLEFWYRGTDLGTYLPYLFTPQFQAFFYDAKNQIHPDGGTVGPVNLERPYGRWRKFATPIRAPLAADGRLMVYFHYALGSLEVDGLSLQPITDRQNDSFRNFLEGTEKP